MKRIIVVIFIYLLLPFYSADAASTFCSVEGYTILTINGVFTDENGAKKNKELLERALQATGIKNINIDFLHNPSHLGGVGDLVKAAYQKYFDDEIVDDYDLQEMLLSASQKVKTEKLLVVAHSQGNFYANSFYDSVVDKNGGVPAKSLGVYSVATPASRVAGGGKWLTSDTDKVIAGAVGRVPWRGIMAPNTHIELKEGDDKLGHNFSSVYLRYRGAQIVEDIQSELDGLSADETQNSAGACIDAPKLSLGHKAVSVVFFVADPLAQNTIDKAVFAYNTAETAAKTMASVYSSITNWFNRNQNVASVASVNNNDDDPLADVEFQTENISGEGVVTIVPTNEFIEPITEQVIEQNQETPQVNVPIRPLFEPFIDTSKKTEFVVTPGFGGGGGGGGATASVSAPTSNSTPTVVLPEPVSFDISEPVDLSQTFNTTTITFKGSASANAEIKTDISFGSTASASGAWQLPITFAEGTTTLSMWAEIDGRESEKKMLDIFVDSVAPDLSFEISECANTLVAGECFLAVESEINLNWSSDEVTNFEIDLNGAVSQTSATSTTFGLGADGVYDFSVTVTDASGNEIKKEIRVEKMAAPVVINEIGWAGTSASAADEWVELYNKTDKPIDLSDFVLATADGVLNVSLSGEIAPNSYFLLERTDDNVISDVAADLIYGNGGSSFALNNNGEEMQIKIGSTVLDGTPLLSACSKWCAGANASRLSMERLDTDASGTLSTNWASGLSEFFVNGRDRNGGQINGTPRARNGSLRMVSPSGIIATDTTLTAKNSPYLIGRVGLTIGVGATLTVEEGVVIKFVTPNEPALTVDGKLVARGSNANPVVFTTYFDDAYGGDTDGAPCDIIANTNCPQVGSWKYINVRSGGELDLEHTIVRYGGRWFSGSQAHLRTMLRAENAVVRIVNSTIELSKRHGLYLIDSVAELRNDIFRKMNADSESQALNIVDSEAVIENPTFENNFMDIYGANSTIECINCGTPTTTPADLLSI